MSNRANDPQAEIPSALAWECPQCNETGEDPDDYNEGADMCQHCVELLAEEEGESLQIARAIINDAIRSTRMRQAVCEDFGGGW